MDPANQPSFADQPTGRINAVIEALESSLSKILDNGASSDQIYEHIISKMSTVKVAVRRAGRPPNSSMEGSAPPQDDDDDDLVFNYEEEDDPEIFFVRYVWEVMVESVTGNIMNWNYDEITLFAVAPPPKLDEVKPVGAPDVLGNPTSTTSLSVDLGGAAGNGASNSAKSEDIGDAV